MSLLWQHRRQMTFETSSLTLIFRCSKHPERKSRINELMGGHWQQDNERLPSSLSTLEPYLLSMSETGKGPTFKSVRSELTKKLPFSTIAFFSTSCNKD